MRSWMRAGVLGLAVVGWAAVANGAKETAKEMAKETAAQSYVWRSVTIKANGFIDGIVYSPAKAGVVYIHTDMGGAYRWDDAIKRWVPLNDGSAWNDDAMKSLGVEALAVDPTDANKAYMACGTYMSPTAIRRTTDGGKTWQRVDVPIRSNGNGSARNAGPRMVVDPNAPRIIYYGTRVDGLWKSTDAGVTWERVGGFPTIGEQKGWGKDTGILWVCIDRSSGSASKASQTIYAGVFEKNAGVNRIYRSTDAGATWAPLPGVQVTEANYFPQRVALTSDGKTMYLTYGRSTVYPGPYGIEGGCVRKVSDPAGPSPVWEDVSPKVKYGFSACVLDPKDSNRIYVGEMGDYNP
ncbi:MAG: WD40/YVTN/BNR-like repeat-containing protein, partial [Tepidisphaeraceae bacterium]